MKQVKVLKKLMVALFFIILFTQCNKLEVKNDPVPTEQGKIASLTCTRTIKSSESVVDGSTIPAGSVLCLEGGTRGALLLRNFTGTASAPITFINSGGQTIVKSSGSYAIKTENCKFFVFSGTGTADQYGIKIDGGHIGFTLDKLSTNFEINNMEISNCGFAGIMAKTDPSCDPATWRENFVMRDLSFHDNYVHNVKGEGFYVGNSFYNSGKSLSCGTVLPHSIVNVKIFNNKVNHSGCEGIQVGCVIEGLKVYKNIVENTGEDPFASYQNNGIQIGEGSGGLMYNNIIKNAPGNGIQMMGLGDNIVFNNIVVNSGAFGVFCDERYTPGNGFSFLNNTIINSGKDGFRFYSEKVAMNTVCNNIIINPKNGIYVGKNTGVRITETNNYQNADINAVKFVNATAGDYQLAAGSPAIDQGMNASSFGVNFDYNNSLRPGGNAYDIGAFEGNSVAVSDPIPAAQSIAGLTLVNADTDKDIAPLTNNYIIDFATIGTDRISIRANTNPTTVGSVIFSLDNNANFNTGSTSPYAINGCTAGNYASWTPTSGTHTLVCTPYSLENGTGTKGSSFPISFTVRNSTTTTSTQISSLTLINADTDKEIATLTDNYVIDFASLGTNRLSVRANTNPAIVGSVVFGLDANSKFRVENGTPYAINGDASGGNYYAWTPALGTHTISCTPYSLANATGTKGMPIQINFTVVNNAVIPVGQTVQSFTLVNADTEKDIATIVNGGVINYSLIGTSRISIRANTNPAIVGSVLFGLDANSKYRVENGAPYAINGDSGGNYTSWTPTLGTHVVTCTPYSSPYMSGTKGTPLSVTFTIVK